MKNVSLRAGRVLVAAAAIGLVGVGVAGCQSEAAPTGPSTPISVQTGAPVTSAPASTGTGAPTSSAATTPSTVVRPPAASTTKATPATTATPAQRLEFPNTTDDVEIVGFDAKTAMVEFHRVVQKPKAQFADLIFDPSDPGVHELPMAANATVNSDEPGGFPFETCPPHGCTSDLIIESVLGHNANILWADIHVNAADQIQTVQQTDY